MSQSSNEKISKAKTTKLAKPIKPIRMLSKDCIMKKIKSRFFKFFANQYMIIFSNYINKNKQDLLQNNIYFKKINNYFLVYATIPKHHEWQFLDKTIFELFHEHSDMNLIELHSRFINDKQTFLRLTNGLDSVTKFVILNPLRIVFKKFIEDQVLLDSFLNKVKEDLTRRKLESIEGNTDCYYRTFKKSLFEFISYYS